MALLRPHAFACRLQTRYRLRSLSQKSTYSASALISIQCAETFASLTSYVYPQSLASSLRPNLSYRQRPCLKAERPLCPYSQPSRRTAARSAPKLTAMATLVAQTTEAPAVVAQYSNGSGLRVSVIGAGNWGSAASMVIGENVKRFERFNSQVRIWMYEELIDGRKLTEIVNTTHINVKYLPNHTLPENVVAVPDLLDAAEGADVLVFVLPHQFLARTCATLKGKIAPSAIGISLIKGIDFDEEGVVLMSSVIERELGIPVSVLSGANVANEIADGQFCESTIAYTSAAAASTFYELFNSPNFRISLSPDVAGCQVFGALKNVVARGAGFVDGLGLGGNTKAALIRLGLVEISRFAARYFASSDPMTMIESAGVADLITTCIGGRNRKVSEAFAIAGGKRSWDELETEMLGGQKLQGTGTCKEVMAILKRDNAVADFPLFSLINSIAFGGASPKTIVHLPMEKPAILLTKAMAHM
jgi:glycerol-3-phosphate dehydrogenase (NAD+)